MAQSIERPREVVPDDIDGGPAPGPPEPEPSGSVVMTRRVHVVLGLVVAALGAWLLYRSRTELAFRGPNNEPGPGYLPVLLTICLIGLGLLLSAIWLFGRRARTGEAPTLSVQPRQVGRALLVWLVLVVCVLLLEPVGFLAAAEVLVLLVIVVVERIRSIPLIVTLLLSTQSMVLSTKPATSGLDFTSLLDELAKQLDGALRP